MRHGVLDLNPHPLLAGRGGAGGAWINPNTQEVPELQLLQVERAEIGETMRYFFSAINPQKLCNRW